MVMSQQLELVDLSAAFKDFQSSGVLCVKRLVEGETHAWWCVVEG